MTTPWEFGGRQLWYYDFDRKKIQKQSSRTLFARAGQNTHEIEKNLNQLIESPISKARLTLSQGTTDNVIEIHEWQIIRALYLLLLFQCGRASENESHRSRVKEALSWGEEKLDQLVLACQQKELVIGFPGHPSAPFFYPSHGFFPIPYQKNSGSWSTIYAIPLTESLAIARVSRKWDMDNNFPNGPYLNGYVSSCSVGVLAQRLAIHPSVINTHGIETVAGMIEGARKTALELSSLCGNINNLDREINEMLLENS